MKRPLGLGPRRPGPREEEWSKSFPVKFFQSQAGANRPPFKSIASAGRKKFSNRRRDAKLLPPPAARRPPRLEPSAVGAQSRRPQPPEKISFSRAASGLFIDFRLTGSEGPFCCLNFSPVSQNAVSGKASFSQVHGVINKKMCQGKILKSSTVLAITILKGVFLIPKPIVVHLFLCRLYTEKIFLIFPEKSSLFFLEIELKMNY